MAIDTDPQSFTMWPYCGPSMARGMFTYEHNRDGGSFTSVSASLGAGLSVAYNGVQNPLQKSTGIVTSP